jgi:hypothetical protein
LRIPYEARGAIGREFVALGPEIVAVILLTMQSGWREAAIDADPATIGEVEITERLRDGMRAALKSGRLRLSKSLIVAPGTESRSTLATFIPDGRTDIPLYLIEVFLRYGEHDPHAVIECKRIAGSNTHLCREYVVEGIHRFGSLKYAENHAAGFMAGYLLNGSADDAARGVNRYLSRVGRAAEHLIPSDVIAHSIFWRSTHARADPRPPIDLHHAFFALVSSPAA